MSMQSLLRGSVIMTGILLGGCGTEAAPQQATTPSASRAIVQATTASSPANAKPAASSPSGAPVAAIGIDAFPDLQKVLAGQTNMSKLPRLKAFSWQISGAVATVEFNINDNLTASLTKDGVKKDMSDIYIALFHGSGQPVNAATAKAWASVADKFGNPTVVALVTTSLDAPTAQRVNWSADKALLELQILPGLWRIPQGSF